MPGEAQGRRARAVNLTADWSALGLCVGHYTYSVGATGVTVVRGDRPFRAAAAVLGRATGTRELDALSPHHLVDRVDAIVLSGGSAYGATAHCVCPR